MTTALDRVLLSQSAGADLSSDGLLLVAFAGCSLDEKPGSNWVQEGGGLPEYICQIAKALKRSGHPTSEAIAMAVGTVKNWAHGGKHVTPETRAKAAQALAEWTKLKAGAKARSAAKGAKRVAASGEQDYTMLTLCADTFNTEVINQAFRAQLSDQMFPQKTSEVTGKPYSTDYSYIVQLWSNFVIVNGDLDHDGDVDYYKIPFSVDPDDQSSVTFGSPIEVKQEWVTTDGSALDGSDDLDGSDLTDDHLAALIKLTRRSPLDKFLAL